MKKPMKAALISALVFPGAGHFFLKKYPAGIILACASSASLYYIVKKTIENAMQIVGDMQNSGAQLDVMALTDLVSKQTANHDSNMISFATIAFVVCWFVGIFDSYREGRAID